jgi:hypothetical protein
MRAEVRFHVAALALLAVFGAAVGCARKPDDAKITGAVQASFDADSGLQGKQLDVQSENGTVTISGTVDNDLERNAAARYAAAAPGVTQVVNNLRVAGEQASAVPDTNTKPTAAQPLPSADETAMAPAQYNRPHPGRHRRHTMSAAAQDDSMASADTPPPPQAQMAPPQAPLAQPVMAAPVPPPPPPPPQKVTIPSGTTLAVRLVDPIDSETSQQGQTFHATLDSTLAVDGDTAIPAGYDVEGHIVEVHSAGKFAGKSVLTLQLDRIAVGGKYYNVQTDTYHREGSSRGKNTAEKVGAGGVIGAIIGGIAGGGKGAAIGAAAGGGVGGGVQAATKGQQIKLPSETVLNFTLESSLTVVPTKNGPNAERRRLDTNQ